jgi:hypothetical protein
MSLLDRRLPLAAVIALSACRTAPAPGAPANTPPPAPTAAAPAGFARADLVTMRDGELTAWAIASGRLEPLGTVRLATVDPEDGAAPLWGDWADRDHLFVEVPPRTVLQVTAAGISPVTVPEEARFKTPRPRTEDDDGLEEGGPGLEEGGLVVTDGAAYWTECPWGWPYDGWQCAEWVVARLWPTADLGASEGAPAPRAWDFASTPPAGFTVQLVDDDAGLRCTPPGAAATELRGNPDDGELVASTHWVSASPPRLLVVYGTPGFADLVTTRWALHDGCAPAPVAEGTDLAPGPAGLWLTWETGAAGDRLVVRRGGDVLGDVPRDAFVRFRPPE